MPHPCGKSTIWTHFGFKAKGDGSIEDWKKVFCRECEHAVSYSGNTSNLSYHLEKNHPAIFTAFKESQQTSEQNSISSSSSNSSQSRQRTLPFPSISNPLPRSSGRHKELVCALTEFVCQDMQPISAVEGIGFRKLVHC